MSKKILISLSVIAGVIALVAGGTIAFFSDTETSSGNTFTAGAIDLKVDNHCFYNGGECVCEKGRCEWKGGPYDGQECSCTWKLDDLDGHVFANFTDLKPGDHGEDTISFHVKGNKAWLCAKVTTTVDKDVDCTEPETEEEGANCAPDNDGELDNYLMVFAWADDGDNIFEPKENETPLMTAPVKIAEYVDKKFPIVDKNFNAFGPAGDPLEGGKDYHIGKAWCFGDMKVNLQTGEISCDGKNVKNDAQTDTLQLDVTFEAVQYRNNIDFTCQ